MSPTSPEFIRQIVRKNRHVPLNLIDKIFNKGAESSCSSEGPHFIEMEQLIILGIGTYFEGEEAISNFMIEQKLML